MKKLLHPTPFGLLLLVWVVLFGGRSTARGEPFIDLYAAAAIPQYANVKFKSPVAPFTLKIEEGRLDTSVSGGGRIGWWFRSPPNGDDIPVMGVAVDAFHFKPDFDRQVRGFTQDGTLGSALFQKIDFDVTMIGLNLMARGLASITPDFPYGQTQLYFGIGPGVFLTSFIDRGNFVPSDQRKVDISLGVDVKAGMKFFINKNLAVFGEYRFTHHSPEVRLRDAGVRERLSTTFNVHHLGVGFSFHFFVP